MVTKYIIDNVSGQTITGNLTINGDFVITGTTNIIKYKVYTALLTQSGVNSPITITSGDLTVGVTYLIKSGGTGGDFTNVGAPNNDANTSFVATGTTPNSWGTKSLEYDEGAPVVTVLENTIGNIWFTYDGVGTYRAFSDSLFIDSKSWCMTAILLYGENLWEGHMQTSSESIYRIFTSENAIPVDDLLANTPIEIRVYN
jgi:hypothetical protein